MSGTNSVDGALARRVLAGEQIAYSELLARHRGPLYRMIRSYVGDSDEALDLVQETFAAAFASLARYDSQRPFRPWLSRIAINKCRDWGRARSVRHFFTFARPIEAATHIGDGLVAVDDALGVRQALDHALLAIARLPKSLKEPLILCAVEGLSQAEAAATLGVSEKAIELRIRRARAALTITLAAVRGLGDRRA